MPSSSSCLATRARLREAFGVTSPSGLDPADLELTEADDRALVRSPRDALRGWLRCGGDAVERLLLPLPRDSPPDLPSSLADIASSSALLLLVRYAARGRGPCEAGPCGAASSPDCSPNSSSLVASSLGLPAGLPRDFDAVPDSNVNKHQVG
jgi:hypothetical protein